ncbi:hypothetical protein DB347_25385 [Opitutaceae bacterium EW11]|nr:hypothetical protein DB347_25385 [Opitutaceae bacterium EW11]
MKRTLSILLFAFVFCAAAHGGIVLKPIVVSAKDLEGKGVVVRRESHGKPFRTTDVTVKVGIKKDEGTFEQCVFVLASEDVSVRSLADLDRSLEATATRVERTKLHEASYTLFGSQVSRSYLAIEVLVGFDRMPVYHRYLVTVESIPDATEG